MSGTENIKATFIVPCYNYGRFLNECLGSIQAQTAYGWECIVINNGSTDNTGEVAQTYATKDQRFQYHYTEQKGVSHARNLAVSLAKGQFIMPVDADDKIAPDYLEKAMRVMEQKPDVKVVYCDAGLFGASAGQWSLPPYSFKGLLTENSIFCTALFRKSDFIKAGGYNENMKEGFEDWDFWISMLKDGGEVYKLPEVLFYYRIRPESRNSSISIEKQLELRRRIYENHKAVYEKYFDVPALIFEHYLCNRDINMLKNSANQRVGKLVLGPLRFLKKLFAKK